MEHRTGAERQSHVGDQMELITQHQQTLQSGLEELEKRCMPFLRPPAPPAVATGSVPGKAPELPVPIASALQRHNAFLAMACDRVKLLIDRVDV